MLRTLRSASRPRVATRSDAGTTVTTKTATATQAPPTAPQDAKIATTLNTLDNLLGDAAKPQPKPEPPAPKPANQAGTFNWPAGGSAPAKPRPAAAPQAASQGKKQQTSFDDVMAFEGLAPEVINGRAAMLGFLAAITTEFSTGESVYSQLLTGGGGQALLIIAAVTVASFAPALRQVPLPEVFNKNPKKVKSFGPFTPGAEVINGRWAMVALALMVLLEGTSGTAFFL